MSLGKGWDFEDDLEDLMHPLTKRDYIFNILTLPIRWFIVCWIVIPLSYLIAIIFSTYPKNKRRCNR